VKTCQNRRGEKRVIEENGGEKRRIEGKRMR
jgi:hypothetical protein